MSAWRQFSGSNQGRKRNQADLRWVGACDLLHLHSGAQGDIRRGSADHQADGLLRHAEGVRAHIPERELRGLERDGDGLRLAWVHGDALEALQFLVGTHNLWVRPTDIKLNYFVANTAAGIGDVDADGDVAVLCDRRRAGAKVGELEGGIAEAEAERIERLVPKVHVGVCVQKRHDCDARLCVCRTRCGRRGTCRSRIR